MRTLSGRAGGRRSTWLRFAPPLTPGTYRFAVRLVHPVNPGAPRDVTSATFRVRS
jgi:hypothetical protein